MSEVTIYIPCFNAGIFLDQIIPPLLAQSHPIKEILIIDDGSTDDTIAIAEAYVKKSNQLIRIVRQPSNLGLAEARNRGIKESKTEFVASMDADCIADKDWLNQMMLEFVHENIVGVGGKLIESRFEKAADYWRKNHMTQDWGNSNQSNPLFLYGHGNVFRKSKLEEVGGYDKRYRTNAEDYHISRALIDRGYELVYTPNAVLKHLKTDTTASVLKAYWRYHFEWKIPDYVNYVVTESKKSKFSQSSNLIIQLWRWRYFGIFMLKNTIHYFKTSLNLLSKDLKTKQFKIVHLTLIMPFKSLRFDFAKINELNAVG